ncbi:hypothetical protein [Desulfitobacterium sp. PCE1]|uniref:hypothetical protein n=1 Tax=Desulfitobacterium sp. PCE1 TaxID=146907 RepID=UPI000373C961|nr:hypothetical protein [Desulfitobacterium sp. PCE1]
MKRLLLMLLLLSFAHLAGGCNDTIDTTEIEPASTASGQEDQYGQGANSGNPDQAHPDSDGEDTAAYARYRGDWKIKVNRDEDLYRMTALIEYYGSTGIHIAEVNQQEIQGSIHSVKGAPSYRQAEVAFSGVIEEGVLCTAYEDLAWGYAGTMELKFEGDHIVAKITRDGFEPSMWGIPEGEFVFVRAAATERVELSESEKADLETFLRPTAKGIMEPFEEDALTDKIMIDFACRSLALGIIDPRAFEDRVVRGADIVFAESVLDDIINRYFNSGVKEHRAYEIGTYKKGRYSVPALGGVTEYPQLQRLLRDKEHPDRYYAIVDYLLEYPGEGRKLNYQYLIKLHKSNNASHGYSIKVIKEVEDPINFALIDY